MPALAPAAVPAAVHAPVQRPDRALVLVALSPLAVILLGHLTARLAAAIEPQLAWVAVAIVYWGAMSAVVLLSTTGAQRRAWLAPAVRRPWWVIPAALLLGAIPIGGILAMQLPLVAANAALIAPWLLFALINPVFEQAYWRGAVQDATARWPAWLAAAWITVLFVASHPLMWGVFSEGNRSPMLYGTLALMAVAWFWMRRVTGSLRWPLVSHVLVDLGNLSVFVFLNVYVPPALG
ncbi:CPBP family intramembrane glutamic endopeptidase [Agrococcus baldri]|uniref:CAAX prenyl protease 2/Lysostaphin resistance protein A-like domain-containing protein n=1 Tax=Agrococcus baldri TaxID=153730 RepID=A0AA87RN92_9MICO|nr:CPBP family intramembrane glutamic endopeptidase [Agrococcus baldri]GEK81117.1 hypothetical protein ABA31_24680 [Agrococcus baldri]